jgi:hypothetical protein
MPTQTSLVLPTEDPATARTVTDALSCLLPRDELLLLFLLTVKTEGSVRMIFGSGKLLTTTVTGSERRLLFLV